MKVRRYTSTPVAIALSCMITMAGTELGSGTMANDGSYAMMREPWVITTTSSAWINGNYAARQKPTSSSWMDWRTNATTERQTVRGLLAWSVEGYLCLAQGGGHARWCFALEAKQAIRVCQVAR